MGLVEVRKPLGGDRDTLMGNANKTGNPFPSHGRQGSGTLRKAELHRVMVLGKTNALTPPSPALSTEHDESGVSLGSPGVPAVSPPQPLCEEQEMLWLRVSPAGNNQTLPVLPTLLQHKSNPCTSLQEENELFQPKPEHRLHGKHLDPFPSQFPADFDTLSSWHCSHAGAGDLQWGRICSAGKMNQPDLKLQL